MTYDHETRMITHSKQVWIPQMGYISEARESPQATTHGTWSNIYASCTGKKKMITQKESVTAAATADTKGTSMNTREEKK
jgi:hypothetical protein